MSRDLSLRRHGAAETLLLRDRILPVYATSHAPVVQNPWFSEAKFWERLVQLYAPGQDFEMVSGWLDDELIGYAFGSPRGDAAATWAAVHTALPDIPVPDEPEPIYIFREFAVRPDHQGRGYGRRIHDTLLMKRSERLAHLLVRTDNDQARGAYTSWGWRRIGLRQPFPDSPVLDVMVLPLPLQEAS